MQDISIILPLHYPCYINVLVDIISILILSLNINILPSISTGVKVAVKGMIQSSHPISSLHLLLHPLHPFLPLLTPLLPLIDLPMQLIYFPITIFQLCPQHLLPRLVLVPPQGQLPLTPLVILLHLLHQLLQIPVFPLLLDHLVLPPLQLLLHLADLHPQLLTSLRQLLDLPWILCLLPLTLCRPFLCHLQLTPELLHLGLFLLQLTG